MNRHHAHNAGAREAPESTIKACARCGGTDQTVNGCPGIWAVNCACGDAAFGASSHGAIAAWNVLQGELTE